MRARGAALRGGCPGAQAGRRAAGLARMGVLCLGMLLVACAGKESPGGGTSYRVSQAQQLFTVAFQDIDEIYIDAVTPEGLVLAGLARLSDLDPAVAVTTERDHLVLRYDEQTVTRLPQPASSATGPWARLAAQTLTKARSHAPGLAEVAPERLYKTFFKGVTAELDAYSRYAGAAKAEENRASRDGFGGIGVRIAPAREGFRITEVIEGTPADRAGLVAGDVILAVDGTPAGRLDIANSRTALRGPVDSRVTLTVRRAAEPQDRTPVAVKRQRIVPPTVSYAPRDTAAYIEITGFNQGTAEDLRAALRAARKDLGAKLSGYVLDLRGNPGGLLDQAVAVADLFLAGGRVVTTHGRHPDSHQYFEAAAGDAGEALPVVVLLNAGSASASEIVAAALQDSRRAVVVGSTSYGKGTVQTVLRLPNKGELTLTWARFHAPSGYALSHRGVVPDICTTAEDVSLDAILAALQPPPTRHGAVADSWVPPARAAMAGESGACPGQRTRSDLDLKLAVRLLAEETLYRRAARRSTGTSLARVRSDQVSPPDP